MPAVARTMTDYQLRLNGRCENTFDTEGVCPSRAARNWSSSCIKRDLRSTNPLVLEVLSLGSVMSGRALRVLCVFVVCASVEGLSSEEKMIVKSAKTSEPRVFYIYPRSGRLFHADYVKDNEIFRSFERRNLMRRGPLVDEEVLLRAKRDDKYGSKVKKHTNVDARRIPGEKKSVFSKERKVPFKVLTKLGDFIILDSEKPSKKIKREVMHSERVEKDTPVLTRNEEFKISNSKENTVEQLDTINHENNYVDAPKIKIKEENTTTEIEKKVEGDHNTHTKNNDTDKTLFVLDQVQQTDNSNKHFQVPELSLIQEDLMKKLVLGDGMSLYPVYTGVKYTYPRTERSLQYAPEMTVQLDTPEVTDYVSLSESNSTSDYQEEGRGRRRRIKKLAFPLLLALKLKAAVMLPLILGLISLVAFKGLWSGLTALGVAAALGLKALIGSGAPRVVVQAPPPPSPHYHHLPPHEYAEYWSRRDDFSDYRPSSWA